MNEPNDDPCASLADQLLVVRCQLGERAAFDTGGALEYALWRYARNLCGNDAAADDATQDVWIRVLRGIHALRDGGKLRPWLFGIAHRVMMDRLRAQYARPAATDTALDDLPAADVDEALEHEVELAAMLGALARLPLIENEVLTLFYLRELSLDEVAQALGIPPGTVKSRLHRARRMLRQQLDRKGVPS